MKNTVLENIMGYWSLQMEYGSWAGPWNIPLWFLRDLFVVMIFSPIIFKLIKSIGILVPIICVIPYLLKYEAFFPGLSSVSFFYFSLGSYLAIKKPSFSNFLNSKEMMIVCITFIMFFFRILVVGKVIVIGSEIINFLWIMVSIVFYFCLAMKIGNTTRHFTRWKTFGASSFVIFAMHSLINGRVSSILLYLAGKQNVGAGLTLIFYILTIAITVYLCYIVHCMLLRNSTALLMLEGSRKR